VGNANLSNPNEKGDEAMPETVTQKGTERPPIAGLNGHPGVPNLGPAFTTERMKELVAALEEPFDPTEIKWRVTNTTQIGSRNGPRFRGQMLAYADPRAYTDRLNELFTPAGWTRDYAVQLIQNFERKERGSAERTISAKIVVTSKVTIHGFGAHTGLGEEWADNDNAGTAAEAQAFKRACSCFGLGRYLYDLEGQWVDLDEKKRPLETPRLPDWARPKSHQVEQRRAAPRQNGSAPAPANGSGAGRNGRGGLYRDEVLAQVTSLSDAVGFSLARGVLKAVANVDDASKIRDMAKLTMTFERLQDLARGVERLRTAIGSCGAQRYSALCRELNLVSDSLDDVPDRATLRRMVETLEAEAASKAAPEDTEGAADLGVLRGLVLREAARVSGATNRTLGDVIQEAAEGAFTLASLKSLGEADSAKLRAALTRLQAMASA
jgi:hypothetical protein